MLNQVYYCSMLLSKTTYTEPDRKENRKWCELFCPAENQQSIVLLAPRILVYKTMQRIYR